MNAAETLFKHATELLENEVYTPIVLQKLAERGYTCKDKEEAQLFLKQAQEVIRDGLLSGEIAPIPLAAVGNGSDDMIKQASDATQEDFLAHAPDITIDLTKVETHVKEAATVACCGYLHSVQQLQAREASA